MPDLDMTVVESGPAVMLGPEEESGEDVGNRQERQTETAMAF